MRIDHTNPQQNALLSGCRTVGDLRSRLLHEYPKAADRKAFLQTACDVIVSLCAEMKASMSGDKHRRLADQLYILALDLPPSVEALVTTITSPEEERARKCVEDIWIRLLDALQMVEAKMGPIELSAFIGLNRLAGEPAQPRGPKVFLSYAHDDASVVEPLRRDLITRGLDVWWDRQILPGEEWERAIKNAIDSAVALVVCFSSHVDANKRSGIFPEILRALDIYRQLRPGEIFLIPVRLDNCEIPQFKIDGTRDLASIQYENLYPPERRTEAIERLVQAIQCAAAAS